MAAKITIEPCSCGHRSCKDFWLVGIGKFVQGSGFTKDEAELLAAAPDLLEALKELQGAIGGYMLNKGEARDRWHIALKTTVACKVHAAIARAEGRSNG